MPLVAAFGANHRATALARWLFVREFKRLQGGHLKVYDYFRHTHALFGREPGFYQTPGSECVPDNPWTSDGVKTRPPPFEIDAAFLAGTDWVIAESAGFDLNDKPIVNLLQGFAHCTPGNPRYAFLSRSAVRVCVSSELAHAVSRTGHCDGEIHVVPAGIDTTALSALDRKDRPIEVLVAGMKRPALARDVAAALRARRPGLMLHVLESAVTRDRFLDLLASARIAILLPQAVEGFFLPPLESMAVGTVAVTLDAIGNRQYCAHQENCLIAAADSDSIATAALLALDDDALAEALRRGGRHCAQLHDLASERAAYRDVLHRVGLL